MYKKCSACKELKLLTSFGKKKSNKDGLQYCCKQCKNDWARANKEYYKKYREDNKEHLKVLVSNWYQLNKESILQAQKENRPYIAEREKQYRQENSDKRNALNAKRRALKLKATPKWLTKEEFLEIESFYTEARNLKLITGITYHVDHIVPLLNKDVCGLHVPWNLQVITATENFCKSNKFNTEQEN